MERQKIRLPHPFPGQPAEIEDPRTPEQMEVWGHWLVTSMYCASTDPVKKAQLLADNPWLRDVLREAGRLK